MRYLRGQDLLLTEFILWRDLYGYCDYSFTVLFVNNNKVITRSNHIMQEVKYLTIKEGDNIIEHDSTDGAVTDPLCKDLCLWA